MKLIDVRLCACVLLLAAGVSFQRDALADEEFCAAIPAEEVRFVSTPRDGATVVTVYLPSKYAGARLKSADVVYGDEASDALRFSVALSPDKHGKLSARIELPANHERLRIASIYSDKKCFRELNATLRVPGESASKAHD